MANPGSEHSTWSASSTERNMACPGAIALSEGRPDSTSEAADWGTCCHTLAERCLRRDLDAAVFIGETIHGKRHSNVVDDEMAETAQTYIDYVRSLLIDGAVLHIEQRFTLDALDPPFDAGGTADAVIWKPALRQIEVVDLKGGRGHVVDATGNGQLRTYGVGALLANPKWPARTIKTTIVQPRAGHKDGIIRSETLHVADLLEWTVDLVAAMADSYAAIEMKAQKPPMVWAGAWLHPGDHCTFCRAAGICPALEQKASDAAGVWFDDLDQPRISNRPQDFSDAELARRLDMADMIGQFMNAVRAEAHSRAEGGATIPGYILTEKIGHRAWTAEDDVVVAKIAALGVPEERVWVKKAPSPAQADKLVGAKKKAALEELYERPSRGTNLTRADKTTRPATTPAVNRHFQVLD